MRRCRVDERFVGFGGPKKNASVDTGSIGACTETPRLPNDRSRGETVVGYGLRVAIVVAVRSSHVWIQASMTILTHNLASKHRQVVGWRGVADGKRST